MNRQKLKRAEGVAASSDKIENRLAAAAEVILRQARVVPRMAIILGSGFQSLIEMVECRGDLAYESIPGFPQLSVAGHSGRLAWGRMGGLDVIVCCGRAHYYEGHEMLDVTWPVRVLARCGVSELVLTNAAGGINRSLKPGDFMLATDHINFTGVNPLRGCEPRDTRRFVDLSEAYSPRLGEMIRRAAKKAKVPVRPGIYLGVAGPSYETPAEIRAFRRLGADAVGMSTIPEVLMARYCGLEAAAISCITNEAAGMSKRTLCHEEVLHAAEENTLRAKALFKEFAQERQNADTAFQGVAP